MSDSASKKAELEARQVAYRALSRRAYSRLEMTEKLQRHGFKPHVVSSVVKGLETENYINDRAFARTWAQKVVEQKQLGPQALREGLHLKGIDREMTEEILKEIYQGAEEESLALKAVMKRLARSEGVVSEGARSRIMSYLTRKGFTPEVIEKVVRNEVR